MCLILNRRFPCQTQQGEEIEIGPHDIYFLLFDALHIVEAPQSSSSSQSKQWRCQYQHSNQCQCQTRQGGEIDPFALFSQCHCQCQLYLPLHTTRPYKAKEKVILCDTQGWNNQSSTQSQRWASLHYQLDLSILLCFQFGLPLFWIWPAFVVFKKDSNIKSTPRQWDLIFLKTARQQIKET